jgi:hypothetical protein
LFPKGPPTQFEPTGSISLDSGITILSYTVA